MKMLVHLDFRRGVTKNVDAMHNSYTIAKYIILLEECQRFITKDGFVRMENITKTN